MFPQLICLLGNPLTSEARDTVVGSVFLYVAGVLVLVLSVLKLASLQLTEAQLMLGLLAALCAAMQLIVMGLLLEIRGRLRARGM